MALSKHETDIADSNNIEQLNIAVNCELFDVGTLNDDPYTLSKCHFCGLHGDAHPPTSNLFPTIENPVHQFLAVSPKTFFYNGYWFRYVTDYIGKQGGGTELRTIRDEVAENRNDTTGLRNLKSILIWLLRHQTVAPKQPFPMN
jgi:hypothetical protein